MSFCFSDAYKELSDTAPLLFSVLGACAARSTDQLIKEEQNHIVTAAACLLKSKHPQMSSLPYLVSTACSLPWWCKKQKTEQNGHINVP